jgi:flagellar basal body rod protein FlgG
MIDTLAMTEAAMLSDVERLRVASHNLANSGTVGFKREISLMRPDFETALQSNFRLVPSAPVPATAVDYKGGALRLSNNPLDVALEGDGFFVLASPSGPVYTRQGSFQLDPKGRLVSATGLAVMGDSGEMVLPTADPRIDRQGNVWDGQNAVGRLRVVQFARPGALEALGGSVYSAGSATPAPIETVNVRQGFVETANVGAMHEMVRLIETMRHFEASQRILRGYDAMTGIALNTLGSL